MASVEPGLIQTQKGCYRLHLEASWCLRCKNPGSVIDPRPPAPGLVRV
jgi:hypothetical protein